MCQEVVFLEALLKNCQKKKQENMGHDVHS